MVLPYAIEIREYDDMVRRFNTVPACDRRTDVRTDRIPISILLCSRMIKTLKYLYVLIRLYTKYYWQHIKGKKGKGAYSSSWNSPQNYGTSHVNRITQYYLPPAFTPTGQVGTWFIDPVRMKGWVGLVGWLHTEMVYSSTDGHPSEY